MLKLQVRFLRQEIELVFLLKHLNHLLKGLKYIYHFHWARIDHF